MIDKVTGNRIEVKCDGTAGPYVIVPESQVAKVCDLFKANDISFDKNARSITDPHGTDTIFDLGKEADVERIQSLFDGAH